MSATPEAAFLAALPDEAKTRFGDELATALAVAWDAARAVYSRIAVDATTFAGELARRLGATASPEQLARTRVDHVYLAIACIAGDALAIETVEREFLDVIDRVASRLKARKDQADEVRGDLRRILFVSEPGRAAGLRDFSGRGDLGSYIRVIATHALMRLMAKDRREGVADEPSVFDKLSPMSDAEIRHLRESYRVEVNEALAAALASLGEESRALLRYAVIDGWTIDRIGELYGVHRATAARWVAAAREELRDAIRVQLSARLSIPLGEVDSVVRLVQSRVDLSLERLLAARA